jgi:outer membrane protein OmpA-like peptidoglycan-associated protein
LAVPFADDAVEIQLEYVGATVIAPGLDGAQTVGAFHPRLSPSELSLAIRLAPPGPFSITLGAGPGFGPGVGTPDVRAFVMATATAGPEPPPPDIDLDTEPTGWDIDHDGDGLTGREDRCPFDPEDFDGFEDDDGCPDLDDDGDGIPDDRDDCPFEPETRNGVDDEDGCPDEGLVEYDADKGRIYIYEKIYFDLDEATIQPRSFALLDAVVGVLAQFPEIRRVEVGGHTDARGEEDYNRDLSHRRAAEVCDHLERHGVELGRLEARGYGEDVLIDDRDTAEAHAQNRRVEFVIRDIED